jgi:predicted TIM-barrel fold metal-dependent hydrolase
MKIDVHAHLYPTDYVELLDSFDGGWRSTLLVGLRGGASKQEMGERIQMMDRAGVDLQVLSVSSSVPFFRSRPQAVEASRFVNDAYADVVHRHPGRFAAFATLPLPHMKEALLELTRSLDLLGMVGVTVTTEVLGTSIADAAFEPLFVELNRRGATLFIHPSGTAVHSAQVEPFTWSVGAPFEDMLCLLQLVRARIPERFPRMTIISAHLGGCAPLLMGRLDRSDDTAPTHPARSMTFPESAARWFFYDTVNGHPPALRCACDTFGVSQLLLGSDVPYWRDENYQHAVDYVAHAGLSESDTQAIYSGNALRLFPALKSTARLPSAPASRVARDLAMGSSP